MADATAPQPVGVVLVSVRDPAVRRAWMAALRAAGLPVRGASGDAERAKALGDGAVVVEVTTAPGDVGAAHGSARCLRVPATEPAEAIVARVREALAAATGGAPPTGRP